VTKSSIVRIDLVLTNVVGETIVFVVDGGRFDDGATGASGADGVAAAAIAVRTELFVVRLRVADISGKKNLFDFNYEMQGNPRRKSLGTTKNN